MSLDTENRQSLVPESTAILDQECVPFFVDYFQNELAKLDFIKPKEPENKVERKGLLGFVRRIGVEVKDLVSVLSYDDTPTVEELTKKKVAVARLLDDAKNSYSPRIETYLIDAIQDQLKRSQVIGPVEDSTFIQARDTALKGVQSYLAILRKINPATAEGIKKTINAAKEPRTLGTGPEVFELTNSY